MAEGLESELSGSAGHIERIHIRGEAVSAEYGGDASEGTTEGSATLKEALQGLDGEIDVLVFLFPPPRQLLKRWGSDPEGRPTLAVACNNILPMLDSIEQGVIVAGVAPRPGAKTHENGRLIKPPSNPMKAFALVFQILTPDTVGAFKERFPYLVPRG